MQKWEYQIYNSDDRDIIAKLNKMGKEGWELVAVVDSGSCIKSYYFKRPVTALSQSDQQWLSNGGTLDD